MRLPSGFLLRSHLIACVSLASLAVGSFDAAEIRIEPVIEERLGVGVVADLLRGAVAEIGLGGRGLCLRRVEASQEGALVIDIDQHAADCADLHEFRPIERVQILLSIPGYCILTRETVPKSQTWRPRLVPLPRTTVALRLASPPTEPSELEIDYSLLEAMELFGYADGGVPTLRLGTAPITSDGQVEVAIADLRLDPFISATSRMVTLGIRSGDSARPARRHSVTLSQLFAPGPVVLDETNRTR